MTFKAAVQNTGAATVTHDGVVKEMMLIRLRVFADPRCQVAQRQDGDVLTVSMPSWLAGDLLRTGMQGEEITLGSGEKCVQYSWFVVKNG